MKMFIVLAVLIAATLAAPLDESNVATVLRYENDNIGVERYNYAFETSDGIKKEESGEVKNAGTDDASIAVRGSFSYVVDGVTYTVNYVADENGFQPEGEHIPKAA